MNKCLKANRHTKSFSAIKFFNCGPLPLLKNNGLPLLRNNGKTYKLYMKEEKGEKE